MIRILLTLVLLGFILLYPTVEILITQCCVAHFYSCACFIRYARSLKSTHMLNQLLAERSLLIKKLRLTCCRQKGRKNA
jgi:hypothetical protein